MRSPLSLIPPIALLAGYGLAVAAWSRGREAIRSVHVPLEIITIVAAVLCMRNAARFWEHRSDAALRVPLFANVAAVVGIFVWIAIAMYSSTTQKV